MSFKRDLASRLKKAISDAEKSIVNGKEDLKRIRRLNEKNANYVVELHSLWSDEGEKDVKIEHRGTLEDAINSARSEFLSVNKRSDVQANYSVGVKINGREYPISEEFWESYKLK